MLTSLKGPVSEHPSWWHLEPLRYSVPPGLTIPVYTVIDFLILCLDPADETMDCTTGARIRSRSGMVTSYPDHTNKHWLYRATNKATGRRPVYMAQFHGGARATGMCS